MGEPTSANTPPYLITVSKALSVDPFINGEYSFNNPSSSWSDERRDTPYANISRRAWDGQKLQRDEQERLQKIGILESNYAFQRQRPLRFSIRHVAKLVGWGHD